jgi:hypothetical protein
VLITVGFAEKIGNYMGPQLAVSSAATFGKRMAKSPLKQMVRVGLSVQLRDRKTQQN